MHSVHVRIADMGIARGDSVIATIGLGSCVAITLHDPGQRIGGMAHVMLPDSRVFSASQTTNRAKFADTAVPWLLQAMLDEGARLWAMEAKMAGGSQLFSWGGNNSINVGERNIEAVRNAIQLVRIRLVGEDVGGTHGRTVKLDVATGRMHVRTSKREIREV